MCSARQGCSRSVSLCCHARLLSLCSHAVCRALVITLIVLFWLSLGLLDITLALNLLPCTLTIVILLSSPNYVLTLSLSHFANLDTGLKLARVVGKHIQVDWRGIYNFQSGHVKKKNKNGTFQIVYTDGDVDNIELHELSKKSITSDYGHKHKIYEWCIVHEK